jgi:hypothetical protein
MTPLRQAIDDYIALRRSLGFKLRRACLRVFGSLLYSWSKRQHRT